MQGEGLLANVSNVLVAIAEIMPRATQFIMAMLLMSYGSLFAEASSSCGGFDLDNNGQGELQTK